MWRSSTSLFIVLLAFVFTTCKGAESLVKRDETEKTYTLFAAGDTQIGRWLHHEVYAHGSARPLGALKSLILDSDVAMANLECVVATTGKVFNKSDESRPFVIRARPEMLDVLTGVGFDIMATANNHSMDFGPEAIIEQKELLGAAGIASFGSGENYRAASSPTYVKVGDAILAFIGIETFFSKIQATKNRAGIFHAGGSEAILSALKNPLAQARRNADLVVVSPHWGQGPGDMYFPEMKVLSRQIIDLGADAILGHGSHLLRGMESYRGRPIIYDMGNLLFDRVGGEGRKSAGFMLSFTRSGFWRVEVHPLVLYRNRTVRATGKAATSINNKIREMTKELDPNLVLQNEGNTLSFNLSPEIMHGKRNREPEQFHLTGSSRPVPAAFRKRTDVVLQSYPDWIGVSKEISLTQGITIIGARNSEAAMPRCAFMAEIVVSVQGRLKGQWRALIFGKAQKGNDSFLHRHPFADGAWPPALWKPEQILIDRTLVRPDKVPPGIYDLFWGMENVKSLERTSPKEPNVHTVDGLVKIGTLHVMKSGIPPGPAGVSWDGRIPPTL